MKNNNKGITLVEVIVALGIVSFVITASYKIITGINSFVNIQKDISSNISSMNMFNKYLTNDIEQSKSISNLEVLSDTSYKYTIFRNDINIEYIVNNHKYKDKNAYDLIRKKGSTEVTIIENMISLEKLPLTIDRWKYNGAYRVSISYRDGDKYKENIFNLSSRLTDGLHMRN